MLAAWLIYTFDPALGIALGGIGGFVGMAVLARELSNTRRPHDSSYDEPAD